MKELGAVSSVSCHVLLERRQQQQQQQHQRKALFSFLLLLTTRSRSRKKERRIPNTRVIHYVPGPTYIHLCLKVATHLHWVFVPRGRPHQLDKENEHVSVADKVSKYLVIWIVAPRQGGLPWAADPRDHQDNESHQLDENNSI